ncbi:MAG TPA: MarR family winged helix-turn-helix transcriptional regulator [Streptosporangiaceae bacterium]|nr:MarR family winged helix-turn-helix transcriptional regulator [Streptosporangiaceae bacterium]
MATDSPRRPFRPLPPPDVGPADPFLRLPSYLMFELIRAARRTAMELFPDEHLRLPHTAVLACLADRGPMSQREVSELLRFDPGDLVSVIDALEEMRYVVRERDTRDRRRYALQLTEAGRLALHERRGRGVRLNEALLAPLTAIEREQLQTLLLRVLAHHDPRFAAADADDARDAGPARFAAPAEPPAEPTASADAAARGGPARPA